MPHLHYSLILSRETVNKKCRSLSIPSIKVHALITSVGLTAEGNVDVPKDPANVAWFSLGPLPGEKGNAVIVGHSGWKNRKPAVFDHLSQVHIGDRLFIESVNKKVLTFVVQSLRTYPKNATTSSIFNSNDGKAHLVFITCKGIWDKVKKEYADRLVVFADLE